MAKQNPPINAERFKEVCNYRNISLRQLAFKCCAKTKGTSAFINDYEMENEYTVLKKDLRKGTMSDFRLDVFAQELNCAADYLRGAFPDASFDPGAFDYSSGKWNELQDGHKYHELLRDLIFYDSLYPSPSGFTYQEVSALTDEDLLEIWNASNKYLKEIARPYIEKRNK